MSLFDYMTILNTKNLLSCLFVLEEDHIKSKCIYILPSFNILLGKLFYIFKMSLCVYKLFFN